MKNLRALLMNGSRLSGIMSLDGETAAGGGGDSGAAVAAAAAAAGGDPWYKGADAELVGHLQNRGWHDKTPTEAALEAARAHREAERFIGHPADKVLKMPKDAADEAGWKALWDKLGVPSDPAKYEFAGLKVGDKDVTFDTKDTDWLRTTASELKLDPDRAKILAAALAKHAGDGETSKAAERTALIETQKAALDQNWGANKPTNMLAAQEGAKALGFTPETVAALESQVGYDKIMEAFRKVGVSVSEGRFVGNGGGNGGNGPGGPAGVTTREQAMARKSELMNDNAWSKRYLEGDTVAAREMTALNVIISGETDAGYERI